MKNLKYWQMQLTTGGKLLLKAIVNYGRLIQSELKIIQHIALLFSAFYFLGSPFF